MKTLVIKVGGAFLQNVDIAQKFLGVIKTLQQNFHLVLVHGGGDQVEHLFQQLNLKTQKVDGLRVTPEEHIPYLVGALAGTSNKQLLSIAIQAQVKAVGICLADGDMTHCEVASPELGAVGQVVSGKAELVTLLLKQGYLPLISSIGSDPHGQLLNVNADQAATALAQILDAELLLLSNVPGVLNKDKTLMCDLDANQINQAIENDTIQGGMIVKVRAAQEAANTLQQPVIIASWQQPELLTTLMENGNLGTRIHPQPTQQEAQ